MTPAEPVDGLFEMIALDVGQGDSFLLRTQEQTVLIDTGEAEYADTVVGALKEYGVEQLDLVIATHMHSDHMGGMAEVLEAVPAKTFIMTELPEELTPTSRVYENLLTALEQSPKTEVIPAQPGDRYSLGDGVTLTILGPVADDDDLNLTSVVCRVDAGDRSFLFTGDMEKKAENDLIAAASGSLGRCAQSGTPWRLHLQYSRLPGGSGPGLLSDLGGRGQFLWASHSGNAGAPEWIWPGLPHRPAG